jgi:hypothetical protein
MRDNPQGSQPVGAIQQVTEQAAFSITSYESHFVFEDKMEVGSQPIALEKANRNPGSFFVPKYDPSCYLLTFAGHQAQ